MIVPLRPWHLMSVMLNLRQADREDFAVNGITDLEVWACQRALATGAHLTALDDRGIPVACFGILYDQGRGVAWLVSTDKGPLYRKSIYCAFQKLVAEKLFHTIEATCRGEREGIRRFFDWLGFRYCGTLPNHFPNGNSALVFSLEVT